MVNSESERLRKHTIIIEIEKILQKKEKQEIIDLLLKCYCEEIQTLKDSPVCVEYVQQERKKLKNNETDS